MMLFDKNITAVGSIIMTISIAIGAFGAHGLKDVLDENALNTFEVGVRYQVYHAFAILFLGVLPVVQKKIKRLVFWLFLVGILFFSGSIYLLSMNSILSFDTSAIAFMTPLGGLLFLIGWFILSYRLITLKLI